MDNLIEFAKEQCEIFPEDSYMGKYLRETIKILQAEPCEDAISRQAVLAIAGDSCLDLDDYEDAKEFCDEINELPPVTPARKKDKADPAGEVGIEKHTDRQIYDGCINLMQKMVEYFQEYLEYLGYDLDKLDEDERFFIGISNMEIVRQLFLYQTGNSGGCSTKVFCEKLGVDPYNGVKFEFDWYEEEE